MNVLPLNIVLETAKRTWRKTLRAAGPAQLLLCSASLLDADLRVPVSPLHARARVCRVVYLDFILPGICAMTVLFGASQAGIGIVRDLQTRFFQRMVRASATPGWILAGTIVAEATRLLAQAVVVALLGLLLGRGSASTRPGYWLALPDWLLRFSVRKSFLLDRAEDTRTGEHGGVRSRREHAAPVHQHSARPIAPDAAVAGADLGLEPL